MHSHQPADYLCPFCDWLAGNETELKQNSDIVYQNNDVTAFIAPKWWINNPGSVIIIPNYHYENIYDIQDDSLLNVYKTVKTLAIAIRDSYDECTGISTRQHNEPAGNQDVWHFHVHVFPRFENDELYKNHDNKRFVSAAERKKYSDVLRQYLSSKNLQ